MELLVDQTDTLFMCASEPGPAMSRKMPGQQRTNFNGESLFNVQVMAVRGGRSTTLWITTTTEPKGLVVGQPVRITDLEVSFYEEAGNRKYSCQARSVERATVEPATPKAQAS